MLVGRHDIRIYAFSADSDPFPAQYEFTRIGTEINGVQKQIGLKKKAKENADDLLQQKDDLQKKKAAQEAIAASKHSELQIKVRTVGNYVHETVPVSMTEDENSTIRTWAPEGFDETRKPALSHHEVLWRLDGYDPVRGVKLVGHRGYCLTGYGFFLYCPKTPRLTSDDTNTVQEHGPDQLWSGVPVLER